MTTEADGRPLTAVRLPPATAANHIRALWDEGRAVLPLDPKAPTADVERVIASLRPTDLVDETGARSLPEGVPVAADVAAVVATSGTTGAPRGVELTWTGMGAAAEASMESVGAARGDRWLCCLPVHHVAGLGILARGWHGGIEPVVAAFDPATLAATDVEFVSLVPIMLARALDAGADLTGFRRILVGAAHLSEDIQNRARAAGAAATDGYGLTETWGGAVHNGRALSGVEVRLGDGNEILFRGPVVMRGYRLDPDATAAAFTSDGWFRSGDVGEMDRDGRLRIVDRLRDVIVTGGVNVAPAEVERVLARDPGVKDICVSGRPDPEWGERVVAYVVPADPANPPTLGSIRAFAADHLAAAKLPRQVILVDQIPRTETGKLLRRRL